MKRPVYLAPSLLAANKDDLKNEIKKVVSLGATYIHFDVMDKDFIGHESFSSSDFANIANSHSVYNDVHIMVARPYEYAKTYARLKAHIITFHYEALKDDVSRIDCIEAIRRLGVKVGMSIKPKTPVEKIIPFLHLLDIVLIMSVEPGKGGQSFMDNSLSKIKKCREIIDQEHLSTLVEVDGGINDKTGLQAYQAGADILVMGTYLFGHNDIKERYDKVISECTHD